MYNGCKVTQIMAQSKDGFIGDKDTIPWRCRTDMKHFALHTIGKVCIMGRNTFDSITPALKNRNIIVVTSKRELTPEINALDSHIAVTNIVDALALASTMATGNEIMVVGGRQIYQQTMEYTDTLLLSTINVNLGQADTKMDWEIPEHVEVIHFEFEPE